MADDGDEGQGDAESGQVSQDAAEVYEELFVPALFEPWAARLCEAVEAGPGQHVLDVACGTGVLAREAARRVGDDGAVTGLDVNPGMLAVARRESPAGIRWEEGRAEELPFDDASFDAVACQFSLMFFEDKVAAMEEMWRVLRPGGRLAVAVWDRLERSPGYSELAGLMERILGEDAAEGLRASFVLGDAEVLTGLFEEAGLAEVRLDTVDGEARFPSVEAMVRAEVKGWTLADTVDDAQYDRLLKEMGVAMEAYVEDDGRLVFPLPAHVVTAEKPGA